TPANDPWGLLDQPEPDGAIPALGDQNTVEWGLGRGLGDVVAYTDDAGRAVRVRIVGILGNSILQGGLLISESQFLRHFAGEGGSRVFLVDGPPGAASRIEQALDRALED